MRHMYQQLRCMLNAHRVQPGWNRRVYKINVYNERQLSGCSSHLQARKVAYFEEDAVLLHIANDNISECKHKEQHAQVEKALERIEFKCIESIPLGFL